MAKGPVVTVRFYHHCCDQQHDAHSALVMSVMNESAVMLKEGGVAPQSTTVESNDAIMHEQRRDPHLSLGPIWQVNQERKATNMDMLE